MARYGYARPYRRPRRYRSRYGHRGNGGAFPFVAIGVAVLAAGATAGAKTVHHAPPPAASAAAARNPVAAQAVAFARAQLGKPYLWGGTGPDSFDCSGLVQAAYASAGITIERTSQDQWATLPHVAASQVRPGDLVFFPGSDGTWSAPGHVAIVISATQIIQAYGTGTPIEVSPLNDAGAGGIVGFARPQVPGGGEAAFTTAVLSGVGAPATTANSVSLAAWILHEWPSWPPGAANNALDTTLAMPGSWNFNTFGGGLHVQAYPSAAEGEQATAETLLGGYAQILTALRSGKGICGGGFANELSAWSGNTYQEVC